MQKIIRKVRLDKRTANLAAQKAESEGLNIDMRALINYIIRQILDGKMSLILSIDDIQTWKLYSYTTFSYNPEEMKEIKDLVNDSEFQVSNDFIVNTLLNSYIKQ